MKKFIKLMSVVSLSYAGALWAAAGGAGVGGPIPIAVPPLIPEAVSGNQGATIPAVIDRSVSPGAVSRALEAKITTLTTGLDQVKAQFNTLAGRVDQLERYVQRDQASQARRREALQRQGITSKARDELHRHIFFDDSEEPLLAALAASRSDLLAAPELDAPSALRSALTSSGNADKWPKLRAALDALVAEAGAKS